MWRTSGPIAAAVARVDTTCTSTSTGAMHSGERSRRTDAAGRGFESKPRQSEVSRALQRGNFGGKEEKMQNSQPRQMSNLNV